LVGFFSGGLVVAAGSNGTIYPYLIRFDSIHRRTNLLYGKVQTIKKKRRRRRRKKTIYILLEKGGAERRVKERNAFSRDELYRQSA
jgi:hypothetical protein